MGVNSLGVSSRMVQSAAVTMSYHWGVLYSWVGNSASAGWSS